MGRLGWLIALASCADPGSPPEQDLVRTFVADGKRVVEGVTYRMVFSAVGVKMPEQLLVNELDRLDHPIQCGTTGLIGVGVDPTVVAIAGLQGMARESTVTMLLEGPAIAKAKVDYEITYDCFGMQRLVGTTIFTFFPNGRIVRQDSVTPATEPLQMGPCVCEAVATEYFFQSFWAFSASGDPNQVKANGMPVANGDQGACTIYSDTAFAVNWSTNTTRYSNGTHALVFESGQTIATTPKEVFSAIQVETEGSIEPGECGGLLGLLAVTTLVIDGQDRTTGTDGIFDDQGAVHTGLVTLRAKDAPVPAGFAVALDLGGARHATVSRTLDRVAIQRGAGNQYFFVFSDELAIGDEITIDPE